MKLDLNELYPNVKKERGTLGVGDIVMQAASDRRIYYYPDGTKTQSAIEEYAFRVYKIVGETKQSWIVSLDLSATVVSSRHQKVKKDQDSYLLGIKEAENNLWDSKNRYKIQQMINNKGSVSNETLKKIAEMIGYKE